MTLAKNIMLHKDLENFLVSLFFNSIHLYWSSIHSINFHWRHTKSKLVRAYDHNMWQSNLVWDLMCITYMQEHLKISYIFR